MKLNLFIFLCLTLNLAFSQNFIATYRVKLDNDKKHDIIQKLETLELKLKVNNNESLFEMEDELSVNDDFNYEMAKAVVDGDSKFYVNLKSKTKIHKTELLTEYFIIETKTKDLGWTITNEKREIGKYTCYKAINYITVVLYKNKKEVKREVTAWFCPEIPSSFGPIGYYGLPGLILELNCNRTIYYLDNICFDEKPIIIKPTKGRKVTKEELDKIKKDRLPK